MMQAIIINYPASRCPYQVRRINLTGHWLFMQPEHIHNHLRLCLRSHRFNELTGARYAAKASLSPSKPFRPQNPQVGNSKSRVPNYKTTRIRNLIFLKGYGKELLWLKVKQIWAFCQGLVQNGLNDVSLRKIQ